ncbi:MAG: hypothetical protein JW938_02395 [Candidatus Omnitrophica bacterium]|nr:hypothetical protein [Candidatus Omnitrophota bacterium]
MKKIIALLLIAIVSITVFSSAIAYAGDTCGDQAEAAVKSACSEKVWWNPLTWFKANKTTCTLKE